MTRVLVTGSEGYIGTHLVRGLCACDWVDVVVGLDVGGPSSDHPKYQFVCRDVRQPLVDLVSRHGIQAVVHLAYAVAPLHNEERMDEINLQGMANVLDACVGLKDGHLLYTSSACVYGLHPDNDAPFTEDSPLRPNEDFPYARDKGQTEEMLRRFVADHPQVRVTVLRPCFVIGPGASHPLALHLHKRLVFRPWSPAPMQFVHVQDLVCLLRDFVAQRRPGVYNVAGAGEVTFAEMLKMVGSLGFPVHWPVLYVMNHLCWLLRLSFMTRVPSPALRILRYPWLVSTAKLRCEVGYEFAYDSRSAFRDFAEIIRKSRRRIWR